MSRACGALVLHAFRCKSRYFKWGLFWFLFGQAKKDKIINYSKKNARRFLQAHYVKALKSSNSKIYSPVPYSFLL